MGERITREDKLKLSPIEIATKKYGPVIGPAFHNFTTDLDALHNEGARTQELFARAVWAEMVESFKTGDPRRGEDALNAQTDANRIVARKMGSDSFLR